MFIEYLKARPHPKPGGKSQNIILIELDNYEISNLFSVFATWFLWLIHQKKKMHRIFFMIFYLSSYRYFHVSFMYKCNRKKLNTEKRNAEFQNSI